MSNPTVATKLISMVKGIFGRKQKETASVSAPETPAAAARAESSSTPSPAETPPAAGAPAAAEAPSPSATEVKPEAEAPVEAAPAAAEEPAPAPAAGEETVPAAEAVEAAPAAESAPAAEEREQDAPVPATAELAEEGTAIAEELAVAEAKTQVASTDLLEKVRKDNAPALEDLPVPTYDELTLPSVRARLRKLTIGQVRDLRAYEVAHAARPEFIRMYDNRIAKLEGDA